MALRVARRQRGVGIEDADDLDILAQLGGSQEAGDVPVRQSGNGEPHRPSHRVSVPRALHKAKKEQSGRESCLHDIAMTGGAVLPKSGKLGNCTTRFRPVEFYVK